MGTKWTIIVPITSFTTSRAPGKSPIYFVKSSSDVSKGIGKCSFAVSMPDDNASNIFYKSKY